MSYDTKTYLLQVGLSTLGYEFGPGTKYGALDGDFGPKTQAAIADFTARQKAPISASGGRSVNQAGLELVKAFEGLFLTAYKCPAGVWTIGYGHTGLEHNDGTVYEGRKITEAEGESLLQYDLGKFAKRVESGATVPLDDNQFAALVSFDFNTGGFLDSTLRKKLNAGDYGGAAEEFLRWNKADGKELAGLTRRRKSERNLFLNITPFIIA